LCHGIEFSKLEGSIDSRLVTREDFSDNPHHSHLPPIFELVSAAPKQRQ